MITTERAENEHQKSEHDIPQEDKDLHATALAQFEVIEEAERPYRAQAVEDQKFRAGDQWPEEIKREREADGRPVITVNKTATNVKQITNDQRQNRPSIKIVPVDDKADVETAKIFQGMIRHIGYNSNADTAQDTAFDGTVTSGKGFWRFITQYTDPMSFNQEIIWKRILNPLSVYIDAFSVEPDGSDMGHAFIVTDISKKEYLSKYPKSQQASLDWVSEGNKVPGWLKDESCRIAEYFYKTHEEKEISLLSSGESVLSQDIPNGKLLPEGVTVLKKRTSIFPLIKWCVINSCEILEKREWLGKWIPIVPVYGEEIMVDGKRDLLGIVRNSKDSQREYNYWKSASTEMIALAPKAPFIVAKGQLDGFEKDWRSANRKNHAYLQYNPKANATPPQRQTYEPPIVAISQNLMIASDDIKATSGIFDAALGNRSNENSGIAIQRRTMQAQTGNFHFVDNLSRSIRHSGRILVDLIPKIYDTAQAARIISEDGEQEIVRINEIFKKNGKSVHYDLGVGKYDVIVETGPSFATKRQEAAQSMIEFIKAYPNAAQYIGDLLAKNMDWPGSSEIADRLKKLLPPEMQGDLKKDQPIPPHIQAQLQQMNQMIEHLTGALNESNKKLDTQRENIESKERIEFAKMNLDATKKLAELQSKEALTLLLQEIGQINQRLNLLDMDKPIEDESQNLNQNQTGAGPQSAVLPYDNPNPTGGPSPGNYME